MSSMIRKYLLRIERAWIRAHNFLLNVLHYLERGHTLRKSIELARDTI